MFIEVKVEESQSKIHLNVNQICSINGRVVKLTNQDILTLHEDSFKELAKAIAPKDRQTKNYEPDQQLAALFDDLHKRTGGKGKSVFSIQREAKLKFLLDPKKGRMTEEQLIKAADNIGSDPFLQGINDSKKRYGDIDYLLRPDKAAKWSEDQKEKKKPGMF